MGFLNGTYYALSKKERRDLVLTQLKKYYGSIVDEYDGYFEVVWRNEPCTYQAYQKHIVPHQNNGHQLYQAAYMDGRLIIAGSETSTQFPGYMEGAVSSALSVTDLIIS